MRKYDSYKDSGIEWLGKIPTGWNVKRLKDFSVIKGRIGFKGYTKNDYVNEGEGALVIGATEMNIDGFLDIKNPQFISWFKYYESPEIMLKDEQILIVQRGSTVGKVVLLHNIGIATINPSLAVIKGIKANSKFVLYYLMSSSVQGFVKAQTSLTAIPMISQDQIGKYEISFPPYTEQTAIAQYLDTKTQALDKKVNLLEKKIGYYKELRKSIINETVTKGLDKTVKLKDSGIDWIGQIPEHWEVKRGKDLFFEFPKSKITANEGESEGIYKFFTSSNEQSKWLDYFTMDNEAILFSTGGCAGVNYCDKEYSYSTDCWAIYGGKKVFLKYFAYYFEKIINEIQQKGFKGSSLEHLQKDFIKASQIIFPPIKEQTQIATYLDHKTQTIDKIVANIQNQITTLKELRKTLINDVVTGKIKVVE